MTVRGKKLIHGTSARPRVCVYRSNRTLYVQVIDDTIGKTIIADSTSSVTQNMTPVEKATLVGKSIAQKAKEMKINTAVFDRNGQRYHGQVKAIAEGLRNEGIVV